MDINISVPELLLLAYLDEHATGYTLSDHLDPSKIAALRTELDLTPEVLRKQVSYIASFGLAEVREVGSVNSRGSLAEITGVRVTGFGANYMRHLVAEMQKVDPEPGRWDKIKASTVKASGKLIQPVAIKLLTDFAASHIGELAKAVLHH